MRERQVGQDQNMIILIVLGSVALLVVLTIITIFIVRKKTSQMTYDIEKVNGSSEESEMLNEQTNEKMSHGRNQ